MNDGLGKLERLAVLTLGAYLAGTGLHAIAAGQMLYTNLLGEQTPAPVAVLLGILLLGLGIFWPRLAAGRR